VIAPFLNLLVPIRQLEIVGFGSQILRDVVRIVGDESFPPLGNDASKPMSLPKNDPENARQGVVAR